MDGRVGVPIASSGCSTRRLPRTLQAKRQSSLRRIVRAVSFLGVACMKKPGLLSLLLLFFILASVNGPARADGTKAGTARVDITPPLPAPYDLLKVATEVAHPLQARVLYLEDEDDRVVLVSTDFEGILRTAYETLRTAISEATGVPTRCIVVNANHSHNAPWINLDLEELLAPHGIVQVDKGYFRDVVAKIAAGARRAKESRRPVRISVGSTRLPELAWNRRTGYVAPENIGRFNHRRRYPIGITDSTLGLVRLNDRDEMPVAALCVYASHYVSAGRGKISSSYSGPAMGMIERELGHGCVALFLQGCAGNIVPPRDIPNGSKEAVDKAGELLAGRALPVLTGGMEPIEDDKFAFGSRRVELPLSPLREHGSMDYVRSLFAKPAVNASAKYAPLTLDELERAFHKALDLYKTSLQDGASRDAYYTLNLMAYGDRLTLARNVEQWNSYDFQALRSGPLCLVFLPGETFVEIALAIREQSPFKHTFVSGYNDLTPVYVPDETAFEEGGFEVGLWCYSTPETSKVMVREASDLVQSLK